MSVTQKSKAERYAVIESIEDLRKIEEKAAKGKLNPGIHDYQVRIEDDIGYDRGTSIDSDSLKRLTPGVEAEHSSNAVRTIIQVLEEGEQVGDPAGIEDYIAEHYGAVEDLEFVGPENYEGVPIASRRSKQAFNRACILED